MGERRKRKPVWDEDETKHSSGMSEHGSWTGKDRRSSHGNGHYHEVPESRTSGTRKPRDNSEWPAWESIEEHPIAPMSSSFKNNAQDGKEFVGGKRYYKEMSPGFDGMELRNYNNARDYDQSHSQRYRGRGRSRSRSRSRSLSRGRERERRRGYTRSRSRSRNDVKAKDQTRSRSPISSRLSYGWGDRRGAPEKSSTICRDFASGSCRRGSQCFFFHPNTTSRRDRDILEDEPTESWRGRTDPNRVPRHSYSRASSGFESRNDVPDPYHEDRRAATCKDFLRGMCRWGDSCRFSHHDVSDDGFRHGAGNASFDKGKNGKLICKFFAAGNCIRENCRFSHDDPSNERRISESRLHDKSKLWDSGPTWDDETKTSDFNDRRGDVTDRRSRDKSNLWSDGPAWDNETKTLDINDRRGEVTDRRSRDRSKLWEGGPTWDDVANVADTNDRQGVVSEFRSRDKNKLWDSCPTWDDKAKVDDINDRRGDGSDSRSRDRSKLWDGGPTWADEANVADTDDRQGVVSEIRSRDKNKLWDGGPTWDDEEKVNGINDRRGDVTDSRSRDRSKLWDGGPTWDDEAKVSDINDRQGVVREIRSRDEDKMWDGGPTWGDETKTSDINERQGVATDSRSHDKSNLWDDGPAWEDAPKTSDTLMPFSDSGNGQIDDRQARSWENENQKWGTTESTLPGESGNYGGKTGFSDPVAKDKTPKKQEHLILYSSQSQDHDGIANVNGQNAFQDNPSLSVDALQQNIYPASQVQLQHSRVIESNQMSSFGSDVFDEVKETNSQPIPYSGNQNVGSMYPGHSSISNESDRLPNMLLPNPPSNGFRDLNAPKTEIVNPLNMQIHAQNDQKTSQSSVFLEANVPQLLASLLNKKLSDQVTNTRSLVNEHPQTHTETPSLPNNSGWAPHVNSSTAQPDPPAASLDLNSTGTDQNSQVPLKNPSPLSSEVAPPGFDSLKTRQEGVIPNSEVADGNKAVGVENKDAEENKRSETQNGHEKTEDGGANKDEKGTRLFKNSLVEFVKEILKPTWKEGRMSRDDHKTVVKKVVEKVSSTVHVDHIPKTQEKVDQYLACSKPKISKLVQAYVERSSKKDS